MDDSSFTLGLSHDVDRTAKRAQFIYYIYKAIRSRRSDLLKRELQALNKLLSGIEPYWNFERISALERSLNVRSTYFFLDETGKVKLNNFKSYVLFTGRYRLESLAIRSVIKKLDQEGWEIGVHGSYNSYLDEDLLRNEKSKLESILGHPVEGTRQHYLNLKVPETWEIHSKLGFLYDSTLGFTDKVGFKENRKHPFFPINNSTGKSIPVLQIPLAVMDEPLMREANPWQRFLEIADEVERDRGVLIINFHPHLLNPWEGINYLDMYERIIRECQKRGARVSTLRDIAREHTPPNI
jgi:hypothetical protein